jgi:DNA mismatch endonuclease, patch repair protein
LRKAYFDEQHFMADRITKEHRSWNMSRIRSKNTIPERIVRSLLHRLGYRFRLNVKKLPGKPDIVLPKYRTVILVHGCFWHRHKNCKYAYNPKTKKKFWQKKFEENVKRDQQVRRKLRMLGWKPVVIWQCQTKSTERLGKYLSKVLKG